MPTFDEDFYLDDLSQQAIYDACQKLRNSPDIIVPGSLDCVMEDFKKFMYTQNHTPDAKR